MIKVIKHGKTYKTMRFICGSCGCEFEADNKSFTAYIAANEFCYSSKCPECGSGTKCRYPASYTQPTKRGHWIDNADSYVCSVCGYEDDNPNKYKGGKECPWCNAEMD